MTNFRSYLSRFIKLICEEPYRLFFPLGVLLGMAGVSHWLFYALGWTRGYSGFFHASLQMQSYLACFVIGFLATAMPRFATAPTATRGELSAFLVFTLGITVFLSLGWWIAANLCFVGWLLAILRFAAVRFLARRDPKVSPPTEFVWIPIGIFHGIAAGLLLVLGQLALMPSWILNVAKPMMLQGFLFSVVLGVGGFLGPRLMGIPELVQKRRVIVHIIAGLVLFSTFWLEGLGHEIWAYALRAIVITGEFVYTGVLPRPPRVKPVFAWLLWISFWMVALGSWGEVLFPKFRVAILHFVFLGGFSLMTFAVATVVILTHGGQTEKLYGRLPVLWVVGMGILVALALRVSADFFTSYYFPLLGTSAAFWLTAAGVWFLFIFPRIFRIPDRGTFDREHDRLRQ